MTSSKNNFEDPFQWYEFMHHVMHVSRFSYPKKIKKFLDGIIDVASRKTKPFDAGHEFYRARLGHFPRKTLRDKVLPIKPYSGKDIGAVPPWKASEGRANPVGISYPYLATDKETAVAEVKPYKGGLVSVASFTLKKKVDLVDFSSGTSQGFFLPADASVAWTVSGGANPKYIEKIIWDQINHAFAKPISNDESPLEYIPTQIVVEILKQNGFKGIIYASSLTYTGGYNVVLFNNNLVQQKSGSSELVEVSKIKLEIKPYEWRTAKRVAQVRHGMSS